MNRFATNLFGEEGLYLQAQFAAVAGFVGWVALSIVGVEVWDWGEWSILLVVPAIIWFILMIRSKSHQINREYMSTLALDYGYVHGERRWKVEVAENAEVERQEITVIGGLGWKRAAPRKYRTRQYEIFNVQSGERVLIVHGTRNDVGVPEILILGYLDDSAD